jgi:hypothetical protein
VVERQARREQVLRHAKRIFLPWQADAILRCLVQRNLRKVDFAISPLANLVLEIQL